LVEVVSWCSITNSPISTHDAAADSASPSPPAVNPSNDVALSAARPIFDFLQRDFFR